MKYEIITPTSTDFNVDRSFEIVQEGFAEAGVEVTRRSAATRRRPTRSRPTRTATREVDGYATFDIAMWDWVGYVDPTSCSRS